MVKLEDIKKYEEYIIEKRRDFHMHPETGFEEFRTSKIIQEELTKMGFELTTGIGVTGMVGVLNKDKKGRSVLLRADIDALNMQEENNCSYKSKYDGKMHACGHDTHTAMLLGACKFFSENKELLHGKLKVVFQSAEEGPLPGGGSFVVNEGHVDDVDGVFGIHITTTEIAGKVMIKPGPAMAAPDEFKVIVKGFGTHASAPESGTDVILTATKIINEYQSIVSRNTNPTNPVVISVCTIKGGTAFNILPDKIEFGGTVRTLNQKTRSFIASRMKEVTEVIANLNGCEAELTINEAYPPLINDYKESEFVTNLSKELLGEENVEILTKPSMGGEDFSYYLEKKPGAFIWLGGRNKDMKEIYYNHNPKFDIDESSLLIGTLIHINVAIEFLNRK